MSFIARKIKHSSCNQILLECLYILEGLLLIIEKYNSAENFEIFKEMK